MLNFKTLRALSMVDGWDLLLRGMVLVPLGLAVGARGLLPSAVAALRERLSFDRAALYPHLMGYVLLLPPAISRMVVGFMLLDQRDDHTLPALWVTPLPLTGYLIYRRAVPMLLRRSTAALKATLAERAATARPCAWRFRPGGHSGPWFAPAHDPPAVARC